MGKDADASTTAPHKGDRLGKLWFDTGDLSERGAGGRLVIAPGKLTRADLAYNYDIIGLAIQHLGTRVGIDQLQEHVDLFFNLSRPRGKKPVTSALLKTCTMPCMIYGIPNKVKVLVIIVLRRVLSDPSMADPKLDHHVQQDRESTSPSP